MAARTGGKDGLGPVAQATMWRAFDEVHLLTNYAAEEERKFSTWLSSHSAATITLHHTALTSPTNYREIHAAASIVLAKLRGLSPAVRFTYHLSPGTPAMAAIWILLAKTQFPGLLIESSKEQGVREADVPFDISAEIIPLLLQDSDRRLRESSIGVSPLSPAFEDIIHRSDAMQRVLERARLVAVRSVPVLIEGESGTGKELLARAIHRGSPRREKSFVAVNCGAIPAELVESEFFGHKRGAFTGAFSDRRGFFEQANGGTLFLDEIGELPLHAQVKMLRVLQEGEVTRIGDAGVIKVDVRIISATNRNLLNCVTAGSFRSDLFYRLGVAILNLPPLRERQGDVGALLDNFLNRLNNDGLSEPGHVHKILSPAARNLLIRHSWPGNVRELQNTLLRAAVWSYGEAISAEDVQGALLPTTKNLSQGILDLPLGDDLNVQELLTTVARHYLGRAMRETGGNKTKAAKLVGLPNYQTLTNWLEKYNVEV